MEFNIKKNKINTDEFKNFVKEFKFVENFTSPFFTKIKDNVRPDLFYNLPNLKNNPKSDKTRKKNFNLEETYLINNYTKLLEKKKYFSSNITATDIISSSGLEKEYSIPTIRKKILKLRQKKLREKTKGKNWFNLPTSEVTNNIKTDFQILKMRAALDKNHVYKKNNLKHISKYFQVGTVVESPADFYNGRIPKSKRRKTIVDELLADAECKNYQKKKYKEIMNSNKRNGIKNEKLKKRKGTK